MQKVRASRMRMAIAKNLKQAQNTYASTTTYQDIDMTNLLEWRDQNRPQVAEKYEVRLGFMGAFTQAATLAAGDVPEITATLNMEERTITYRDYTNISIAVSTPRGLVTPVLRNCENQSIVEIERRVAAVAQKVSIHRFTIKHEIMVWMVLNLTCCFRFRHGTASL